jgi:nicotinamide riboside transporter PnuC
MVGARLIKVYFSKGGHDHPPIPEIPRTVKPSSRVRERLLEHFLGIVASESEYLKTFENGTLLSRQQMGPLFFTVLRLPDGIFVWAYKSQSDNDRCYAVVDKEMGEGWADHHSIMVGAYRIKLRRSEEAKGRLKLDVLIKVYFSKGGHDHPPIPEIPRTVKLSSRVRERLLEHFLGIVASDPEYLKTFENGTLLSRQRMGPLFFTVLRLPDGIFVWAYKSESDNDRCYAAVDKEMGDDWADHHSVMVGAYRIKLRRPEEVKGCLKVTVQQRSQTDLASP